MPLKLGVEAVDRRIAQVQRLALGQAFGDVEQHDIAQLLQADQMRQRAADLSAADQRDFLARHRQMFLDWTKRGRGLRR